MESSGAGLLLCGIMWAAGQVRDAEQGGLLLFQAGSGPPGCVMQGAHVGGREGARNVDCRVEVVQGALGNQRCFRV